MEKKRKIPLKKTERDVRLLETFLKTKDEDRTIEGFLAFELNECICQFISVRTKECNVYEPISLRSLKVQVEEDEQNKWVVMFSLSDDNLVSENAKEHFRRHIAKVFYWDSPNFMNESLFTDFVKVIVLYANDPVKLYEFINYEEEQLEKDIMFANKLLTAYCNEADVKMHDLIRVEQDKHRLYVDVEDQKIVSLYLLISDENDRKNQIRKELNSRQNEQEDDEEATAEKESFPLVMSDAIPESEEVIETPPIRPDKPCYYPSQIEMGTILKQRIDAIMKYYHDLENLNDRFKDVEFVIYTARFRMLSNQTEERLLHPDAGVLSDEDKVNDCMFMYILSDAAVNKHRELKEKIENNPSTLFVIIADECHWGITKGTEEKPSAHNLFINNFCEEPSPENVVIIQVSATPYNLLTQNSRIPEKSNLTEFEREGRQEGRPSSELHIVHWTEVEMKNFEKGVKMKLKCGRWNGSARYLTVNKEAKALQVCSNPQEASTFVVEGEHGKVTLKALQNPNLPNGEAFFVRAQNGSISLVSYKNAKKDSEELQFQVKLEFGFGVAAFESLASKGAYICVDKENQVQLWGTKEKRERGVTIFTNQIDPNDTSSSFEFFLEDCSPVEASIPVPQYLSLNYYLSTLNKESREEQKIREDKNFQDLVDAGRRQDKKDNTSNHTEGSLLCAEYAYHILAMPSAADHESKIEQFCKELEEDPKTISLKMFNFVRKMFENYETVRESETGKMIQNLIGKAINGKGHMTIVRAKNMNQANEFYSTLQLARKVADLNNDFEVIRDYGGIQIQNQLMNSRNPFFQKLQPNVCPEPECGCKEFTFVQRKLTCGKCRHVHKQITQYEDLEHLACILILVEKGRMGDTFPHSFNCLDIRLSFDRSKEFGKSSTIFLSSLIQELGRMCRYTTLTCDNQSSVPYALVGRHLIKKLKESLKRSPAISATNILPDRYMVKAVKAINSLVPEGRITHTRRWRHFMASKDSYDFENTSKHENRILLQAEPQIGKTGSYLYLIKLLRDDILGNKDDFVFTIETTERDLQCETYPTERNSPDLPYWKDMREAESLLEKPIRRGKYTVGGKFYTHKTESFPLEYKEKLQRKKDPYTKEMTPSEVSSEVDGSNEMRAWPYSHFYSCSSCLQLLQSADPTEAEWIWLIPDANGSETRIRYSIPSVVPYDLLQKRLPKQLPATNCDWGKLDLDKQMTRIPVITYWIFHPSHRDPKKCTLNYKHVMVDVDSGTKIQYIQAVVVRKEKFDSFKQNWGKTHLIIQLPDKLPGYNSSPETGGIGFARLFIQKLASLLKLEYAFVFDDNVAIMSEPVFEDGEDGIAQIKRNEHRTTLMKRCAFSSPMHQMQSLVQGKGQPPVDHTHYSLEDDDDAKLKEMFKSFPQYSYTGPASVNEKLSRTEGYAVLGMTKSIPNALKPFGKSQVYSAVLLNVKATAESNAWYRPWPCWEDLRFNDDCDKAGLWVVKFNRYHLWKIQYRDWIINLESPSLFLWDETTTLKDVPEERCMNETTEMEMILSYLNSQTANTDDEIQKAVLGEETSSNEKNTVFLKTVYEKLKVPECNLKGSTETQVEKEPTASTLLILHHITDPSFYTDQKWFFTASNKIHTRLIFLRSAEDTKPETSITQIKSERCFQYKEIVERNPSVSVYSVDDPGACSLRCLVVDVTFVNNSCYNKEPTNEVSLSDEPFVDSVQTDAEKHSSSPSVRGSKMCDESNRTPEVLKFTQQSQQRLQRALRTCLTLRNKVQQESQVEINDSCCNKELTNGSEVSLSDESFVDCVQMDTERHSSSFSVMGSKAGGSSNRSIEVLKHTSSQILAEKHSKTQQDQLTNSQVVTNWTQESSVGQSYNNQRGNMETSTECYQEHKGEKPNGTIDESNTIQDEMEHEPYISFLPETKAKDFQVPEPNVEPQQDQNKRKRKVEESFSGEEQTSGDTKKMKQELEPIEGRKIPSSYDNTFTPLTNSPFLPSKSEKNQAEKKLTALSLKKKLEGTNDTTKKIVELWEQCSHPNSDLSKEEIRTKLQSYKGTFEDRDEKGYNALLKACSLPGVSQNLVNHLINGEKVNINCHVEKPEEPNFAIPAIILAVKYKNAKIITFFIKRKSDLLLLDSDQEGNTVLHHAVFKVKKTAFDKLFPLYKKIEWKEACNKEGKNALDVARELYQSEQKDSSSRKKNLRYMVNKMEGKGP